LVADLLRRKCGNRYLAWAFMVAGHFAIRILPAAKRFYERRRRQRHALLVLLLNRGAPG